MLFFANKSLANTDRYAGALSWRKDQMLFPHFSGSFLLAAFLRQWSTSMCIPYSQCNNSCKLYQLMSGTFWIHYVLRDINSLQYYRATVFHVYGHLYYLSDIWRQTKNGLDASFSVQLAGTITSSMIYAYVCFRGGAWISEPLEKFWIMGGGALDNTDNWLECSTHRVRQLKNFREKLVEDVWKRKKMHTKKGNTFFYCKLCFRLLRPF